MGTEQISKVQVHSSYFEYYAMSTDILVENMGILCR